MGPSFLKTVLAKCAENYKQHRLGQGAVAFKLAWKFLRPLDRHFLTSILTQPLNPKVLGFEYLVLIGPSFLKTEQNLLNTMYNIDWGKPQLLSKLCANFFNQFGYS